tara:strand:+ start:13527 stop:15656 length:2130 start_codon:yes stop_codon:yes gene_type:complete
MSLIVLNSQGQDPAEWENHFGRGIKLPRNAEICLCGVNLNKWEKENGANIVQDVNDAFIVAYGNKTSYLPYSSYLVKIKPGNYTEGLLASALSNALAVGNYQTDGYNYQDIPVSPFRGGLLASAVANRMKFTISRQYVYREEPDMDDLDKIEARGYVGVIGQNPTSAFVTNLGLTLGVNDTAFPTFDTNPFDLTYAQFNPKVNCKAAMITRPLWNGSNGAGILQPATGSLGTGAGILPEQEYGYSWYFESSGLEEPEHMIGWRGGIFRNTKQTQVATASGKNVGTQAANRTNLNLDWAAGGLKYDMWWVIEEFRIKTPGGAAGEGTYEGGVYYMPTNTINNGQPYLESNKVKIGHFRWTTGDPTNPAATNLMMINFRPVDGKGGTDAAAPVAGNVADQTKCCIDIRVTRGVPLAPILAGVVPGMISPATGLGDDGYVAVTNAGGKFDLYSGAPIFMGADNPNATDDFTDLERVRMKGIYHDAPNSIITGMAAINGNAAYVTAPAVIANMEQSFLDINFAFSPLTESQDAPFIDNSVVNTSKRYSNMASTIGFREGRLSTLNSSASSTGISSDYESLTWNDKETVCVVQIPTLGIDGELGGGSGNFGGANTAQILGVVGLQTDNEITGHVYREPNMENWIKIKNLAHDSINQLRVKLTDTTGRKLKCLMPESTIWIKMRECRNDGGLSTGGVNPVAKPTGMMDRGYNSFY